MREARAQPALQAVHVAERHLGGETADIAGLILGTGAGTQIGSGTTILTADNSHTGGTTVSAGTLQLGNCVTFACAISGAGAVN